MPGLSGRGRHDLIRAESILALSGRAAADAILLGSINSHGIKVSGTLSTSLLFLAFPPAHALERALHVVQRPLPATFASKRAFMLTLIRSGLSDAS